MLPLNVLADRAIEGLRSAFNLKSEHITCLVLVEMWLLPRQLITSEQVHSTFYSCTEMGFLHGYPEEIISVWYHNVHRMIGSPLCVTYVLRIKGLAELWFKSAFRFVRILCSQMLLSHRL